VRHHSRPLPHDLLHQVGGRAHRRSQCRLEGPLAVGDRLDPNGVPRRRWHGEPTEGLPLAAPPRSAREVMGLSTHAIRGAAPAPPPLFYNLPPIRLCGALYPPHPGGAPAPPPLFLKPSAKALPPSPPPRHSGQALQALPRRRRTALG